MRHEPTAAEGLHNHPVRCCCVSAGDVYVIIICPACPEHGALVECPSCHTIAGHPHTDYCQAVAPAEYPGQPDHCTYPRSDHGDGRGCDHEDCSRHGNPMTNHQPCGCSWQQIETTGHGCGLP